MTTIHRLRKTDALATCRGMDVVIVAEDSIGSSFVSTLVRVNDKEVRYLGISVSKRRLEEIKSGEITLRQAFLTREGVWIDGYAKSPIPTNIDSKIRSGSIPEAYLPPDLKLRPAVERDISRSLVR